MRPRSSERGSAGRAALALGFLALVSVGGTVGSSTAQFTASATARLTTTTRVACTPTNPYPATVSAPAMLPTLWWRFDTLTGAATVNDLTGHGNTGSVTGTGLTFGPANAGLIPCDTTNAMRQAGNAGSTGFVVLPTVRSAPTTYTIATWLRTTSLLGGRVVGFGSAVAGGSAVSDRALLLDLAGRPVLHVRTSTGNLLLTAPTTVSDNKVHFLVATFDGTSAKLYVDGALVAQTLVPVVAAAPYAGYWRTGWDQNTAALIPGSRNQAQLRQDELALWEGRVLSGTEIGTLWRSNHW